MKLTLAVLTLSACSAATCPSDELYGHDAELVYLECGGLQLEVTQGPSCPLASCCR